MTDDLAARLARTARSVTAATPAFDAERAARLGLVDVAYADQDSPIGTLLLATTDVGLVRISFGPENPDAVLEELADRVSPRVLRAPRRLDRARRTLDRYFAGRGDLDDLPVDLRLAVGWQRDVLDTLRREVPLGTTISYAGLAVRAGKPRAARAVGNAMAQNPVPLVVPCHRVVPSGGGVGNYGGGPERKAALLALEGAALELR
jgi:methylated-DNA-[protein]-cysteine S-methyltransferase